MGPPGERWTGGASGGFRGPDRVGSLASRPVAVDADPEALTLSVLDRVSDVPAADWDRLLGEDPVPFLRHAFLTALEEAGTLELETGWVPRIPVLYRGSALIAAVPAYLKLHSFGEFVFDHAWAHFAERCGIRYYPKLLVGVPFTPATGPRFLTAPGEDRARILPALARALTEVAQAFECSSVHVNFTIEDEIAALEEAGYLVRHGIQYHWRRYDDEVFEDYLGRFNSKKRNQLKRELRAPEEHGVRIDNVRGEALAEHAELAFQLYLSTVEKFVWGRQYLNQGVFDRWVRTLPDAMELVLATHRASGDVVAGAVNFSGAGRMYGRYWGCFEELKHLHFNVCYYKGVRECIERKLDVFEPGAGGEHKLVRGFEPTIMLSGHWIAHPGFRDAVARHLEQERRAVDAEREAMMASRGKKRPD